MWTFRRFYFKISGARRRADHEQAFSRCALSAEEDSVTQHLVRIVRAGLLAALFAGAHAAVRLDAQATRAPYTPPKTADGQPDISGFWQVVNTANWDIQDHGAWLGVPAGTGVVEGNEIPYKPEMLARKQQNSANRSTADPEAK